MFTQSKNNIITVNRGDTFTITLPINVGTPTDPRFHELVEGDKVYFGLMEPNQPFEYALIRKVYDTTNQSGFILDMEFNPEDTEELLPGKYYYSIKLQTARGEVFTILPKTIFTIID